MTSGQETYQAYCPALGAQTQCAYRPMANTKLCCLVTMAYG